jgi:hypothetical protein
LANTWKRGEHPGYIHLPFLQVSRLGSDAQGAMSEIVWQQTYEGRLIESKPGSNNHPVFKESLQMPPGTYLVRYGLKDCRWELDEYGVGYLEENVGGPSNSAYHVVK